VINDQLIINFHKVNHPQSYLLSAPQNIGVGAQSTLGGTTFLPEKYVWKINIMPEFYMILSRKIIKIPKFLWYLTEKLARFPNFTWFLPETAWIWILHNYYPNKIFFRILAGTCPPCPHLLRLGYKLLTRLSNEDFGWTFAD